MAGESELNSETLSQRIVQAARLAVSVHLFDSLRDTQHFGRRIAIGGAGPVTPGDARQFSADRSASRVGIVTGDGPVAIAAVTTDVSRRTRRCSDGAD